MGDAMGGPDAGGVADADSSAGIGDATGSDGGSCTRPDGGSVDLDWAQWVVPNLPVDVSAGAPNAESYQDNGDGTVTDNVTGLMWAQSVGYGTYMQAQSYCAGLMVGGHCDWRVPTWVELHSIVDFSASPTINSTYFPQTPSADFWASTLAAGMPGQGWRINFARGNAGWASMTDADYVHCVR
jgi:hypothetical protein